jgi:toxin YoeB
MKNITFAPEAFEQFNDWAAQDKKIHRKIITLINDILREPFTGLGKPEPVNYPAVRRTGLPNSSGIASRTS